MNNILVTGTQIFMNTEIPVVSGGFGENCKCISDKAIADVHGVAMRDIRRRITDNIARFRHEVDYIDLKQCVNETHTFTSKQHILDLLTNLGYAKQSITQAEHIYLLSERGYAKLTKIMDSDLAWEIHDKLIDEYFQIRNIIETASKGDLVMLASQILGMHDEVKNRIACLEHKIDTGFNGQSSLFLEYTDCIADGDINNFWKQNSNRAQKLVKEIRRYGNFENDNKVFSRIYLLMRQKRGIDIARCKENYMLANSSKSEISAWTVIIGTPSIYQCFMDVATEMLKMLKSYGSPEEYIISSDVKDAHDRMRLLAAKHNSNLGLMYKNVYKHMCDKYGIDWKQYKSKGLAVRQNPHLQEFFIKAVNDMLYDEK